jgi:hypothetical protein
VNLSIVNVESLLRGKGFQYTAFPAPAFYYQNFSSFFPPKADENGNLSISYVYLSLFLVTQIFIFRMPITNKIAAFDVSQIGGVVAAVS